MRATLTSSPNRVDPTVHEPDQPVALALDFVRFFYPGEERYYTFNLLAQKSLNMTVDRTKSVKGYYLDRTEPDGQGGLLYIYTNSSGEEITLTEAEVRETVDVRIGTVIDKKAFMVSPDISGLTLMFPTRHAENLRYGARPADNQPVLQRR